MSTPRSITATDLTIEEQALLVEGVDAWETNSLPERGVRGLFVTDGPHGVRKVRAAAGGFAIGENEESTAFPPAVTVASSWNVDSAFAMGEAIGKEARAAGVDVILGPGINIKRSPLCGRNFEYFSEDPLVSGTLGSALVRGLQAQGVGASVKHFAANSNEDFRFVGDSIVDERALREIYLRAFERVVTEAEPQTVMCSYNRLNGTFASESRELLTGILREEWGFDGLVMTDWGATDDRVAGILAGCDLDMPGQVPRNRRVLVESARTDPAVAVALAASAGRVLELVAKHPDAPSVSFDVADHARLSGQIAREGAVLLENNGILPLDPAVAGLVIVGEMFENMRYQGAGSSLITPPEVVSPRLAFDRRGVDYVYARGYSAFDGSSTSQMRAEALAAAGSAEVILFFGGLTDFEESEGFDRSHMRLGAAQLALLDDLIDTGTPVVLVLFVGSPVELPMAERLAAVLTMNLPGMRGGEATAALVFGEANPSGKLAETWVRRIEDSSPFADYNRAARAQYYESIYVGYRFHDRAGTDVAYPFGHGLSYTSYEYADLTVHLGEVLTVGIAVTNTGAIDGDEVVQVYVTAPTTGVFMPEKELRGFARVRVPAGETRHVEVTIPLSDLAYWNVSLHDWVLQNGEYELIAAASAHDIRQRATFVIEGHSSATSPYPPEVDRAYAEPPRAIPHAFTALVGRPLVDHYDARRLTLNTRLVDARRTLLGRAVGSAITGAVEKDYRAALAEGPSLNRESKVKNSYFVFRMMPNSSMRSLAMSSGGTFPYELGVALELFATGHPVRGIRALIAWRKGTR